MHPTPNLIAAWRIRAAQNLRAATLLASRQPPLLLPAVSRIYYACFQATCAALLAKGIPVAGPMAKRGESPTMCAWRRVADYAIHPLRDETARKLAVRFARLARELGISEEA